MSRAEVDFKVSITFEPQPLGSLLPAPALARYPLNVPFAYYLKASIFEGLQLNLLGFKGAFPDFPQDSTVNQFFSEARFEAYRRLGFAAVERMLDSEDIKKALQNM